MRNKTNLIHTRRCVSIYMVHTLYISPYDVFLWLKYRSFLLALPGHFVDLAQLVFHMLAMTFSLITFANKSFPPWTERDPIFHLHHFIRCYFFICVNLGGIWMRFILALLLSCVFIFLLSFLFRSYYHLCPSDDCRRS